MAISSKKRKWLLIVSAAVIGAVTVRFGSEAGAYLQSIVDSVLGNNIPAR